MSHLSRESVDDEHARKRIAIETINCAREVVPRQLYFIVKNYGFCGLQMGKINGLANECEKWRETLTFNLINIDVKTTLSSWNSILCRGNWLPAAPTMFFWESNITSPAFLLPNSSCLYGVCGRLLSIAQMSAELLGRKILRRKNRDIPTYPMPAIPVSLMSTSKFIASGIWISALR